MGASIVIIYPRHADARPGDGTREQVELRAQGETVLHGRDGELGHVAAGIVGVAEAGEGEVCSGDGICLV